MLQVWEEWEWPDLEQVWVFDEPTAVAEPNRRTKGNKNVLRVSLEILYISFTAVSIYLCLVLAACSQETNETITPEPQSLSNAMQMKVKDTKR